MKHQCLHPALQFHTASGHQFVLRFLFGIRTSGPASHLKVSTWTAVVACSVLPRTVQQMLDTRVRYLAEVSRSTFPFHPLTAHGRQLAASFPHHRPIFPNPTP